MTTHNNNLIAYLRLHAAAVALAKEVHLAYALSLVSHQHLTHGPKE